MRELAAQVLYQSDGVRLSAMAGETSDVVLAFHSVHPDKRSVADVEKSLHTRFSDGGKRHVLALHDHNWDWLSRPGDDEGVVQGITNYAANLPDAQLVGYGNSAGATVLMSLMDRIALRAALVIGPQLDANEICNAFDPRHKGWKGFYQENHNVPQPFNAFSSDAKIVILNGLRGPDAGHAALCPAGANIQQYLFPDMGHNLGARLSPDRVPSQIIDRMCANDMGAIDAILLRAGALRRGPPVSQQATVPWARYTKPIKPKPADEGHTVKTH